MAYHLKRSESVAEGIRRIAREEIESAADQLSKGHRDRDEAIHEARKSIKKVRAVLRLVHPELGDTYYQESSYLRDVGRKLSSTGMPVPLSRFWTVSNRSIVIG